MVMRANRYISNEMEILYDNQPYKFQEFADKLKLFLSTEKDNLQLKVVNFDNDKILCKFYWIDDIINKMITFKIIRPHQSSFYRAHMKKIEIIMSINKAKQLNHIEYIPCMKDNSMKVTIEYTNGDDWVSNEIPYYFNVHSMIMMKQEDFNILVSHFIKSRDNLTRHGKRHDIVELLCSNVHNYFIPPYIRKELEMSPQNLNLFENTMNEICSEVNSDWVWVYNMEQFFEDKIPRTQLVGGKLRYIVNEDGFQLESHIDALHREITEEWLLTSDAFTLDFKHWFNTSNEMIGVFTFSFI
jgi:hypothetical protein